MHIIKTQQLMQWTLNFNDNEHTKVSDKLINAKADVAFMQDLIKDQLVGVSDR